MSNYQNIFNILKIPESQSKNYLKNKKLCEYLQSVTNGIQRDKFKEISAQKGSFIILSISKVPEALFIFRDTMIRMILNDELKNNIQIEEFIKFFKITTYDDPDLFNDSKSKQDSNKFNDLKLQCGVGINFNESQIDKIVEDAIKEKLPEISEQKEKYNFGKLMLFIKDQDRKHLFIEGKMLKDSVDKAKTKVLELIKNNPVEKNDSKSSQIDKDNKNKTNNKSKPEPKNNPKNQDTNLIIGELETSEKLSTCIGREIKLAVNPEEVKNSHYSKFGKKTQTRFPPEPNGYLHIGHAKAMRFSFNMAQESGGCCYLRFDDTNPYAEDQEYIDNIIANVKWLGYTPFKITYSSDYFDNLYNYAEFLIEKGYAQVCELDSESMRNQRYNCIESPYRNRPASDNLALFRLMRLGYQTEGQVTLRLKVDMQSPNPTMRDPVAYRIMQTPHPKSGDRWCIYPTQDFTHCIVDSLEGITHSLCTLEFEIRRDLQQWILDKLGIWKPSVWEQSRLNISQSVLSKRKIIKLVKEEVVQGWDDPRLFTLMGLRRRGYSPDVINAFVDLIGVARRGNDKMTDLKVLEQVAKDVLDKKCARSMAVMQPVLLKVRNIPDGVLKQPLKIPNNPKDTSMGQRQIDVSDSLQVDKKDWRDEDSKDFQGLSFNKEVGLKYLGVIKVTGKNGNIIESEWVSDGTTKKPKGWITWLNVTDAVRAKINIQSNLLTEPDLNKVENDWMSYIDQKSVKSYEDSQIHKDLAKVDKEQQIQFEREGYFVADLVNHSEQNPEFNLIVKLTDGFTKTNN